MNFIDSHCHLDRLDLAPYGDEFAQFMNETVDQGLDRMLCVSISLADYPAMRALTHGHAGIDVSVGVHPNETDCAEPTAEELALLAVDPTVVAVGETGLDYFRDSCDAGRQQERFRRHIQAALAVGKPLIDFRTDAADDAQP